jgi:hypothetical protein
MGVMDILLPLILLGLYYLIQQVSSLLQGIMPKPGARHQQRDHPDTRLATSNTNTSTSTST